MSERYRVVKSYHSPYIEPLTMRQGERLRWEAPGVRVAGVDLVHHRIWGEPVGGPEVGMKPWAPEGPETCRR